MPVLLATVPAVDSLTSAVVDDAAGLADLGEGEVMAFVDSAVEVVAAGFPAGSATLVFAGAVGAEVTGSEGGARSLWIQQKVWLVLRVLCWGHGDISFTPGQ